jgi:hypothetical protein
LIDGEDRGVDLYIFCPLSLAIDTKNRYFWCMLLKTDDEKNESPFLMTIRIISRHYKKMLGVTLNHFSTSGGVHAPA